jgi:hypothetical protein
MTIINPAAIKKREYWIEEIRKLSSNFGDGSERLGKKLSYEIQNEGLETLLNHLRLCGDIPESYRHDTSEEKQYSKYTDFLLSESYKALGLKSLVLKERADAADVEVIAKDYSFVADAKAFRLSRTAKNQKDFKVQAMDGWKRGKPFAMVVCPIYQLPARTSQIYSQASSRDVCIFTYSHLAMLVSYSMIEGKSKAEELIHEIFKVIQKLNPSKDASAYWLAVNKRILDFSPEIEKLWRVEKMAAIESIATAKEEALKFLASKREKIMKMTYDEAIKELINVHKIESRIETIKKVCDNGILGIR